MIEDILPLANQMADTAGDIIRQHFRTNFNIERKSDDSPVTIADRAVEKALRDMIENARPQDGIIGEEYGNTSSQSGLTWVIDPIDGTKSFMIGRPTFGTLIALWDGDTPLLGIIDQPISKERWTGAEDQQTTFNGTPIQTRPCSTINDASICSTSPAMFAGTRPVYEAFETGCKMIWGGDCYMYGLLASGHLDIAVEASLSPYDFAALIPVVQGAGGKICDWQGQPMTLESKGEIIALGDETLWPEIQKILN